MPRALLSILVMASVALPGSPASWRTAKGEDAESLERPALVSAAEDADLPEAPPPPTPGVAPPVPLPAGAAGTDSVSCGTCPDFSETTRPQDTMWYISTRCLGCPWRTTEDLNRLAVEQYLPGEGWVESSATDLLGSIPHEGRVLFYVHGNRIDAPVARNRGWAVYHRVAARAVDPAPIHYITWSWPSSQIRGQLRDVRTKAARTETDCYYLGLLLREMAPETRVSLHGHSFGARISIGATHLVAGGSLCAGGLPDAGPAESLGPQRVRIVVTAAATHNYWMQRCSYHALAPSRIDRMLVLYNPCDPYLRRYKFITKRGKPQALGYTGYCGQVNCADGTHCIDEMSAAPYISSSHFSLDYVCSDTLMDAAAPYLLWQQVP